VNKVSAPSLTGSTRVVRHEEALQSLRSDHKAIITGADVRRL
jgi:hypothetical protein